MNENIMKSEYTILGSFYRAKTLIASVIFLFFLLLDQNPLNQQVETFFALLLFVWGISTLWVYPDFCITNKGIKVFRLFGMFTKFYEWKSITMTPKTFGGSKLMLLGLCVPFIKISSEKDTLINKHFYILDEMSNYNEVVLVLKEKLVKG